MKDTYYSTVNYHSICKILRWSNFYFFKSPTQNIYFILSDSPDFIQSVPNFMLLLRAHIDM